MVSTAKDSHAGAPKSSPVRAMLSSMLKSRVLGVPAAIAARSVGKVDLGRKISVLCGYVSPVVPIDIPAKFANGRTFEMGGAKGQDPVSRDFDWFGWGAFEKPFPDLFASCSRNCRVMLDVGAFSGLYSMIATTCSPDAVAYAFEPYPVARALLEANLTLNRQRLGDRITIVPLAAGEAPGTAQLFVPSTTTKLLESASSLNSQLYSDSIDQMEIQVVTLDDFLAERKIGPVDLMKIDVETYEPQVLRGAKRMLEKDRPIIFVEILPKADADAMEAIRAQFDYRDGVLVEEGVRWFSRVQSHAGHNDHVLCPAEKVEAFRKMVEYAGYGTQEG